MTDNLTNAQEAVDRAKADLEAARLTARRAELRAEADKLERKATELEAKPALLRRRAAAMREEADNLTALPPLSTKSVTVAPGPGSATGESPRHLEG